MIMMTPEEFDRELAAYRARRRTVTLSSITMALKLIYPSHWRIGRGSYGAVSTLLEARRLEVRRIAAGLPPRDMEQVAREFGAEMFDAPAMAAFNRPSLLIGLLTGRPPRKVARPIDERDVRRSHGRKGGKPWVTWTYAAEKEE